MISNFFEWLAKLRSVNELELEDLEKLGEASYVKLETYYNRWRNKLKNASDTNKIITNGWAYSTLSGISLFENHIRATEFRRIYFNRPEEVMNTFEAISDYVSLFNLGGIILYGYGNLFRENYFIEAAKSSGILSTQKVYLIDCSIFYHILAKSSLNPLRKTIDNENKLKIKLLDIFDNPNSHHRLKEIRSDLNPTRKVIHLFLGNTFCNTEASILKDTLKSTVLPGDFVVGEYANYPDDFFEDTSDDYVSEMACYAAAEICSLKPEKITVENKQIDKWTKIAKIDIPSSSTPYLPSMSVKSMLRRKFHSSELTDGQYEIINKEHPLGGKLKLETYRNLGEP